MSITKFMIVCVRSISNGCPMCSSSLQFSKSQSLKMTARQQLDCETIHSKNLAYVTYSIAIPTPQRVGTATHRLSKKGKSPFSNQELN